MNRWELLFLPSMLVSIFLPIIIAFLSGSQEKARVHRMAEHRMNARLLRLDI